MPSWQHSKTLADAAQSSGPTEAFRVSPTFLGFLEQVGVIPTNAQAELCRVAFDGCEPVDRSLAARLFGEGDLPVGIRRVVAAVCGRRAGKTYLLIALRLVWGMLVRHLPPLPPRTKAGALILAPRDRMRLEAFNYALGVVTTVPWLAACLVGPPKVDTFTLRRPSDGREVELVCGVATAGGTAARSKWWTDIGMDECCFYRDDTNAVNDKEMFRAATATLLPDGQAILASTPWAQAGLLYDYWSKRPDNAIVAHAPTLLLHDSPETRAVVALAEQQDPDNARREFGAEFMTSGTTVFFEAAAVDAAITDEPFVLEPGDEVSAGVDLAFIGDSSALIFMARRGETLHVFDGREERPAEGMPLDPEVTVRSFARAMVGKCDFAMCDRHYWLSLANELAKHDLVLGQAPTQPAESYVRARNLLRGKRVRIHPLPFRDRLVQQMREVQGKPTSGGGMSIVHPRWSQGGHGDLVAALVLALWQLSGDQVQAAAPDFGTKEWEQERVEARHRKWDEEQEKARRMPWLQRADGTMRKPAEWRRG